jgi:hypothetical protein
MTVDETIRVQERAVDQLVEAGLPRYLAIEAFDRDTDWRLLRTLLERGCPPETALGIAA